MLAPLVIICRVASAVTRCALYATPEASMWALGVVSRGCISEDLFYHVQAILSVGAPSTAPRKQAHLPANR
jgi:hypothetical protein